MKFMKNKTSWNAILVMLVITFLGTILRLLFIDKAEGLWNDEYTSWYIAAIPLGKNFVDAVLSQCHMPLYYLYLKFFIHFFGNSDLMLRLTSVLTGVISIWPMYYVGKELKDKKLGYLCAGFTAISSFLIYFSQEVRFYSILFLFSACFLLFTLRLAKKQNLLNFVMYLISAILIMLTHTIGFVFVFFSLIFMSMWISKINENYKKKIILGWGIVAFVGLLFLPFTYKIFTELTYSQWWGHFTFAALGFLVTDYFSPTLTNIVSSPENFFYNFTLGFVLFALLPAAISLIGLIRAFKTKRYEVSGLFFASLAFVFVLMIMSATGKLVFMTKYSIEIYPTLIALVCLGWSEFKNKIFANFIVVLFCLLNFFYILTSPIAAPKVRRNQGHKIVAELLEHAGLKHGDFILLNYYPQERFEKYFNFKGYNVTSINKGNFPEYISNIGTLETLKDGKNLYKPIFSNIENKYFDKKIRQDIVNKIKPNQKVTMIFLNDVAMLSPIQIKALIDDQKSYQKTPFLFLAFSYLKNEEIKEFLATLSITKLEQKGSWTAITFTKN